MPALCTIPANWSENDTVEHNGETLLICSVGEAPFPDQVQGAPFLFHRFADIHQIEGHIVNDGPASDAAQTPIPQNCRRVGHVLAGFASVE